MLKIRNVSIYSALLTLVVAGVLPLFLLVSWFAYTDYQRTRDNAYSELLILSRALVTVVDLEIAAREAVCQALATLPALQEGDLQTFYERAQRMLELLPEGSAFILADSRGQQLVNTNRAYGASLPVRGDLTSVRKVFETRQRWLSDVFMGAVSQEPVVGLDIPVFRNGDVIYELALSLPISNLRDILTAQRLPEGWVAAVLDRQGTIIARTRDNDAWVGKKAAAPLRKDMSVRRQGLSGGRTLEGVDVISAFTTSPQTNWTVAIGRPQAEITDPLRRRILLLMAIIAAVVTLGILLTAVLGRQVAVPIAALARNAASLSRGEAVRPVATPIREIAHVGAALSAAAAELREREAAVQAAVDRVEAVAAERAAVLGQLAEGVIATDAQGRNLIRQRSGCPHSRRGAARRAAGPVQRKLPAVHRGWTSLSIAGAAPCPCGLETRNGRG